MMPSRPPTAVTTCFDLTPAAASAVCTASATMPGSMTSPSTIASARSGATAALTSSGSFLEWSMTATFTSPEPMSRPTVVFLRPKSAMSAGADLGSAAVVHRTLTRRRGKVGAHGLNVRAHVVNLLNHCLTHCDSSRLPRPLHRYSFVAGHADRAVGHFYRVHDQRTQA